MTPPAPADGVPTPVAGARVHLRCIVCGHGHAHGLGVTFHPSKDGRGVEAAFDCRESVEGYAGLVHGGVVSMLLDGAMAHCLFHQGLVAHTGELTVRFRHPIATGREACVHAWRERSRGRVHMLAADLRQDGLVKAVALAKFVESADVSESPAERKTR